MRLIDADKLKKVIHCAYSDDLEILEKKIDLQPTAYDVDNVVQQLEEVPSEYNCIANEFQRGATSGASWMKKRAIEIVKHGGVGKVVE